MRRQLALMAAGTTSMVVVAFLIPLGLAVQTIVANDALSDAEVQARSLAPAIASISDRAVLAELVHSASATSVGSITVFMPDGEVLGQPAGKDDEVALAQAGRAFSTSTNDGARVFVPVVTAGSGAAVVEVRVPESRLHRGVAAAWAILGATGGVLILLAVAIADRMARGVVVPTRALARAADLVAQGRLTTRVTPGGPPEVADVGRAFNTLAERMGDLLATEREAAADLSHRLRTPLTALRLDMERLPGGPQAERIAADVEAMEGAITDVIGEMRRQRRDGRPHVTGLASAVRGRLRFWTMLAGDQDRPCKVSITSEPTLVPLDAEQVETVLDALLTNVFAHTPPRTAFSVTVDSPKPGKARLVVEDQGPGFPQDLIGRGQSGVESTGLGLDIVRRIAGAAGGSLAVSSLAGGGARVEVALVTVDERPVSSTESPRLANH